MTWKMGLPMEQEEALGRKLRGQKEEPNRKPTCATTVLGLGMAAQVGTPAAKERKLHLPTYPYNWPPFLTSQWVPLPSLGICVVGVPFTLGNAAPIGGDRQGGC